MKTAETATNIDEMENDKYCIWKKNFATPHEVNKVYQMDTKPTASLSLKKRKAPDWCKAVMRVKDAKPSVQGILSFTNNIKATIL